MSPAVSASETPTLPAPQAISAESVRDVLDGRWRATRAQVRELLRDPRLTPRMTLTMTEHRARVTEQLVAISSTDIPKLLFPKDAGGLDEVGAAITGFEVQAHADLSLLVKSGVQWGLFGGAVRRLGTEDHHQRYLADIMSTRLMGCFAMTETGHGSDVQSIGTTATYDADTAEFVVHTPSPNATKNYIGNAACDGRLAVVFCQLETRGEGHGVHAVLVPIRDEAGDPMPGVTIEDDMAVLVRYSTGATMTYHLTAYAPWEGYRIAFNGSRGRLELEVVESDHVSPASGGLKGASLHGAEAAAENGWVRLQVRPFWQPPVDVEIPGHTREGHGGADARMTEVLFGGSPQPDPLGRCATERDGAKSLLTGLAANASLESGQAVRVASLLDPHRLSDVES